MAGNRSIIRLMTLNVWAGKIYSPLLNFIGQQSKGVDIFCLQEVYNQADGKPPPSSEAYFEGESDIYGKVLTQLGGFNGHLSDTYSSLDERLAIVAAKSINPTGQGEIELSKPQTTVIDGRPFTFTPRLQWIAFRHGDKEFTVANVHGLWIKGSKDDTPERLEQSKAITEFLGKRRGPRILCGDFNLDIGTRSIGLLEESLTNLVREYGIRTTRSKLYAGDASFADYVFVSKEVKVSDFEAMDVEVSDHLPLVLDFS